MSIIKIRTRIYVAAEGKGDQSFIRLLQFFADQNSLSIHLDCEVLGGGGYESMLKQARRLRERNAKSKSKAKLSILVVDSDRGERKEDGWTLERLKKEANKSNFVVFVQRPNQEGLLWRMIPGNENKTNPQATNAHKLLLKHWPDYRKPPDFRLLSQKFNINDIRRTATVDSDLNNLLSIIGLKEIS